TAAHHLAGADPHRDDGRGFHRRCAGGRRAAGIGDRRAVVRIGLERKGSVGHFPVFVYHHRLRRHQWISLSRLQRYQQQTTPERAGCPLRRLWWHAAGGISRNARDPRLRGGTQPRHRRQAGHGGVGCAVRKLGRREAGRDRFVCVWRGQLPQGTGPVRRRGDGDHGGARRLLRRHHAGHRLPAAALRHPGTGGHTARAKGGGRQWQPTFIPELVSKQTRCDHLRGDRGDHPCRRTQRRRMDPGQHWHRWADPLAALWSHQPTARRPRVSGYHILPVAARCLHVVPHPAARADAGDADVGDDLSALHRARLAGGGATQLPARRDRAGHHRAGNLDDHRGGETIPESQGRDRGKRPRPAAGI
ncbi:uncharacterized protein METZ01_LOCUS266195, partial [marine metagenome]